MSHIMGILGGIGIGLIIGGMVGYVSKGSAIKAEQKRKEFKQLQKDKEDLEKQAAEIARREAELRSLKIKILKSNDLRIFYSCYFRELKFISNTYHK
jgi:uncharacterized membrane-anchored protein YhcB (DUF1043 family)